MHSCWSIIIFVLIVSTFILFVLKSSFGKFFGKEQKRESLHVLGLGQCPRPSFPLPTCGPGFGPVRGPGMCVRHPSLFSAADDQDPTLLTLTLGAHRAAPSSFSAWPSRSWWSPPNLPNPDFHRIWFSRALFSLGLPSPHLFFHLLATDARFVASQCQGDLAELLWPAAVLELSVRGCVSETMIVVDGP